MKNKIGLIVVLLAIVSVVTAQTVTLGTVGYTRVSEPVGFHIAGMQFNNATNTPATVYGDSLANGSQIYKWNGSTYVSSSYGPVFVPEVGSVTKWDTDIDLVHGEGYWVESPSVVDSVLSGDVPMDDVITNSIIPGFQICSYPYPVDRVVTNLGFSPTTGDQIYMWDGSTYVSSSYGPVFVPEVGLVTKWDNETLPIGVGEGFWYQSAVNTEWIVSKPYN